MENLMKKILQCLCLLLVVPVVSIFALSGCKDKNKSDNKPREYISYSEADSILTSAYTALYGEEGEGVPVTDSVSYTASAAATNDIKLIKQDTKLETIKINDTDFTSSINGEIKIEENCFMYVSDEAYVPIELVRTLIKNGITDIFGKVVEFSYQNNPKLEPDNLTCKLRVNVYDNVFAIEVQRTSSGEVLNTTVVNIVFDNNLKATDILVSTITKINTTDVFAFAPYNLESKNTKVLKFGVETIAIQTSLKSDLTAFSDATATPITNINFSKIYAGLI